MGEQRKGGGSGSADAAGIGSARAEASSFLVDAPPRAHLSAIIMRGARAQPNENLRHQRRAHVP
eukprot:7552091-Pyramimonas_sp.AAC.1